MEIKKQYDAIISGAGLGGLFAAAKLTKEGKRVLVVEKHNIPGGYASFFKRKGYTFETALHLLDGFLEKGGKNERLLSEFGLLEKLNLFRAPELYSTTGKVLDITIKDNYPDARTALVAKFPEETKAIDSFLEKVERVHKQIHQYNKLGWKKFLILPALPFLFWDLITALRTSLGDFLDTVTENEALKIALAANTHYYHDSPYKYGFLHYCAGQGSYWKGGAAMLPGGSYQISINLAKFIMDNGGEIVYNSSVEKTHVENGAVTGITLKNVKNSEETRVESNYVVANIPYPVLLNTIEEKAQESLNAKFKEYAHSNSLFSVYIGMKKPLHEIGSKSYTLLIFPDEFQKLNQMYEVNQHPNFGKRIIDLTDYSILKGFESVEKPTLSAVVVDSIEEWEKLSPEEYKERKELHIQEILDRVEEIVPGFKENIEYLEAGTPKTFQRYTSNPNGVIYGFAQDVKQIGPLRPQVKTGIKGLYLASAWSTPGGGMSAVATCGFNAAVAMLKEM